MSKLLSYIFLVQILVGCDAAKSTKSQTETTVVAESNLYFGQTPPSSTPVLFAPGLISKPDRYEFGCTLSGDGTEFYFGVDNDGKMEIYRTTLKGGVWSEQENIFPNDSCSYNDPMFSPEEDRLYFISNRPTEPNGPLKDIDLWFIKRDGKGWSNPTNVGAPVNNHLNQYYCSFTQDGSMYFGSKDLAEGAPRYAFDIYKSKFNNGVFQSPEKLPEEINTERYEADVFIAPDESYMIFCSIRRNGLGIGDLYISFKNDSDQWTEAVSMGEEINSDKHELCPFVTKDGKYLFYTSDEDLYWVSTKIIDEIKVANK